MKIVNLTQHNATEEQKAQGVFDLVAEKATALKAELTFNEIPCVGEIKNRATRIALIAQESGADAAMIGGAPYLMASLEESLNRFGIKPLYAFSVRESVDEVQPDGSVVKKAVFKHSGFVEV